MPDVTQAEKFLERIFAFTTSVAFRNRPLTFRRCRHFLTLADLEDWEKPLTINTDRSPIHGMAIGDLKKEGKCPQETMHRRVKYLNNVVEADHGHGLG